MKLLLLDNYDSFTWNLVHGFEVLGADVTVVMNDEASVEQVLDDAHDAIVISPGPGRPENGGISLELIRTSAGRIPLLGVCLGHQAIAQAYGGRVVQAPSLMHGKTSPVRHRGSDLFQGVPSPFEAMRYHSLVVDPIGLPEGFEVTARTDDGVVMALEHAELPLFGVQFHPESILTATGKHLLSNFLRIADERQSTAQVA